MSINQYYNSNIILSDDNEFTVDKSIVHITHITTTINYYNKLMNVLNNYYNEFKNKDLNFCTLNNKYITIKCTQHEIKFISNERNLNLKFNYNLEYINITFTPIKKNNDKIIEATYDLTRLFAMNDTQNDIVHIYMQNDYPLRIITNSFNCYIAPIHENDLGDNNVSSMNNDKYIQQ